MSINKTRTATTLAVLLTGSALLLGTAAMARGPGGAPADFSTLDADGNGELTAQEFQQARTSRMAAVDADGDGFVSAEEISAHIAVMMAERQSERIARMIETGDENKDGKLSVDEMSAMGGMGRRGGDAGLPRGMDADGNGVVTAEEYQTAMAQMGDRRGEMRGRFERGGHRDGHRDGRGEGRDHRGGDWFGFFGGRSD